MTTNTEKQRKFKKKMYMAGFKQKIVWIKRKEAKAAAKMSQGEFFKAFRKLADGWDKESLARLYDLLIKITKGTKEAAKLKERQ